MRATSRAILSNAILAALGLSCAELLAQPVPPETLPVNYQFEIALAAKDGAPRVFKVVTTGERVRAGFVVPPGTDDGAEPAMLRVEADFEVLSPEKVWVRNLTLVHHAPGGMRMARPGVVGPTPEWRAEPPGAGAAPGQPPRLVERRRAREGVEVGMEAPPGEAEGPRRNVTGPREAPMPGMREVPALESMLNTTALLTLGQPLVVREDPTGRITLTLRRLEK